MSAAVVIGASGGIGAAITRALLARAEPQIVVATGRKPEPTDALRSLSGAHRERLRYQQLDVSDEGSIARAAARVSDAGVEVELLINCAGVLHAPGMRPERRLFDIDSPAMLRSFEVNALGPLLVAKHFAALFPRRARCCFASLSARVGSIGDNRRGGWYAYRCAKAAQNMGLRNLSIELRRRAAGIVCVALHPGTVDSALSEPFQASVPASQLFTAERSAASLLSVIDALEAADNGGFFAWDGSPIPW